MVTVLGLELGTLVGGVVVIEQVFGWSGVGWLALTAVKNRDYPLLQGIVLLVAIGVSLANLLPIWRTRSSTPGCGPSDDPVMTESHGNGRCPSRSDGLAPRERWRLRERAHGHEAFLVGLALIALLTWSPSWPRCSPRTIRP